jgi:mannose/cellobiose epimerase-like protein (N-acyl-D-glucosamine 2-epimerase family)
MAKPDLPSFRSSEFLRIHVLQTMAFYGERCIDPTGGFFHFFRDDGSVYDAQTRHLVSSTRFVITHAWAARRFPDDPRSPAWLAAARYGLSFLEQAHHDPVHGGYLWQLHWEGGHAKPLDATRHCYGLAFVLLAHAESLLSGITEARSGIATTFELMERHFWQPADALYADDAVVEPDGRWTLSPYRGQNANMHACEALIAAFDATHETRYLERAAALAESVTGRLAGLCGGLVWEHYGRDASGRWQPDWHYNKDDRSNIFRPWGFQTGHLTEWAKLLLALERRLPPDPNETLLQRARAFFAAAVEHGWDRKHGGLAYGFAGTHDAAGSDGKFAICDGDKYFWVQAETVAAAAALGVRSNVGGYWDWYDRIWAFSWAHMIDHEHGAWYRILSPDNHKLSDEKSPAGKVDYHTMGACYEVMDALER